MCGIAGVLRWNGEDGARDAAERIRTALGHRGPDGHATFARGPVAFAHCRLAIIDLAHGGQPMANETGSIHLTGNCEIYNHRELRRELTAFGHVFATESDAEVVVHGYEQWGMDLFERLRGMFAVGLVDFDREQLIVARDHLGIKPLVFHRGAEGFAFASEVTALRHGVSQAGTLSVAALELYLRYQFIPSPVTAWTGIQRLPPASYLQVPFDGSELAPVPFWRPQFRAEPDGDDRAWEEDAERVVCESVKSHLMSDVPFGVLLSGGVDSTLVSCIAQSLSDRRLPAFSVDFDDRADSELQFAREAAESCGLDLHVARVGPDSMAQLPEITRHLGEPFGDPSILPSWELARLARGVVPMVLSGDGGDEAFGGYDTYGSFLAIESARDVARAIRQAPVDGAHRAARGFRQRLTGSFKPRLSDWQRCMTYFSPGETRSLWRPEFRALAATASTDRAAQAARLAPTHDPLGFAQSIDYDGYLPDDILTKVDIASMAHGLEVRTPLVDRCVVEFASRLPLNQRVRRSADGTVIPKFLLRQLLSHRFSDAFVNRPKRGFLAPHARWFLEHPPTRKLLQRLLLDTASPLHRVFQAERLRGEFNAHTSERDNSSKLWLLLMLGLWLDGEPGVRLA